MGFRVDLSEDNEPTEELGERPGPEDAATPATHSEPDDALPGLPLEFTDFTSPLTLLEAELSSKSPGDPVFSWVLKTWDEGAHEEAFGDNPPLSGPSFFMSSNDCESAEKVGMSKGIHI